MSRLQIVFITRSLYWYDGAGLWQRTRAMLRYFGEFCDATVVHLGSPVHPDESLIAKLGITHKFIYLKQTRGGSHRSLVAKLTDVLGQLPLANAYIVDKTELSYVLPAIPQNALKLIDTHDLVSDRTTRSAVFGVQDYLPLTAEYEIELLNQYDAVICIQENEFRKVSQWLGSHRSILAPHPVAAKKRSLRHKVQTIGFIASNWHANVDGLQWFLRYIWPLVGTEEIQLTVAGSVCKYFAKEHVPRVSLLGHITSIESFYDSIDIAINPVRYGAGLKIKTVEAVANGIPLVTTGEGANGLEFLANRAFLMASSPIGFAAAINDLIANRDLRRRLRINGQSYAKHLTPQNCFRDLTQYLIAGKPTQFNSM